MNNALLFFHLCCTQSEVSPDANTIGGLLHKMIRSITEEFGFKNKNYQLQTIYRIYFRAYLEQRER